MCGFAVTKMMIGVALTVFFIFYFYFLSQLFLDGLIICCHGYVRKSHGSSEKVCLLMLS